LAFGKHHISDAGLHQLALFLALCVPFWLPAILCGKLDLHIISQNAVEPGLIAFAFHF
jgi:hypothetical protein